MKKTYTLSNLESISKALLQQTEKKIFLFYADMGVGKTTLIKQLIKQLGVSDNVNSPTFSLVNEYRDKANHPIYHFDFYRIEDEVEALDIGIEEYFNQNAYCFVEWPENIENLLPLDTVSVYLTELENGDRLIDVKL